MKSPYSKGLIPVLAFSLAPEQGRVQAPSHLSLWGSYNEQTAGYLGRVLVVPELEKCESLLPFLVAAEVELAKGGGVEEPDDLPTTIVRPEVVIALREVWGDHPLRWHELPGGMSAAISVDGRLVAICAGCAPGAGQVKVPPPEVVAQA